jgi:glycosyltransferase involved in cell wall biosynthesis
VPRVWGTRANADLKWRLKDGVRNILSVGPFEESSNLERLITVFAFYLSFGHDARLLLLGPITDYLALAERFYAIVAESGLGGRVVLLDPHTRPHAAAAYAVAELYISLEEVGTSNDKFLDAMAYDVPILALANEDSRSILRSAGILVAPWAEDIEIGMVAHYLTTDETLRKAVLAAQRRHLRTAQLSAT